jgi:hypothetical protein
MDHFGIGIAMLCMARVYVQSARRSGRTTSLVESLKDGDRVVFASRQEADAVQRICRERGVTVKCVVLEPKHHPMEIARGSGTSEGRTIFDHSWVESYYLHAIERAQGELDQAERELSGFGEAHRETRRRAIEIAKWRP